MRGPLVALAALSLLLALPAQALPGSPWATLSEDRGWRLFFTFFWISQDVVVAATVLYLTRRTRWAKAARSMVALSLVGLFVYEVYDVAMLVAFRRPAVLYDDLLLVGRARHLVTDLAPSVGLGLVGGAALLVAISLAIPYAVRVAARGLSAAAGPGPLRVLVGAWLLVGAARLDRETAQRDNLVQSTALRLVENLRSSAEMRRALAAIDAAPPEAASSGPAGDLELVAPPNVYLLLMEAYGAILLDDPALRGPHLETLASLEARLESQGWRAATQRSAAPVVGGTSWLAITTVLGGVRIDNQQLYRRFINGPALVGLPQTLRAAGYVTATCEPATRVRPGLPLQNPFGFEHRVYGDDLGYVGPSYGWGVVPDQFSLNVAHDRVFSKLPEPHFVFFMSVSTHVPWNQVPPLVDDWRTLNQAAAERALSSRMADRVHQRFAGLPELDLDEYRRAVDYDLEVFVRYILEQVPPHSVVIVAGDHQPLTVGTEAKDPSTPVHVITRDAGHLALLEAHGFRPGLVAPDAGATTPLQHEGLASLVVHTLARRYGRGAVPPHHPDGLPRSVLRRAP